MCSINHDLKAIYLHIPKNGGLYIEHILNKYYGFKSYYLTHEDHKAFGDDETVVNNGFLHLKKYGIYKYFETSKKFSEMMNMDEEKWNSYYKFTFVRNPYTKFVSAFNYLQAGLQLKDDNLKSNTCINTILDKNNLGSYVFTHLCITQKEHMKDKNGNINFNFIGRFEQLDEDLITILKTLHIKDIKHGHYIKNNVKINDNKSNVNYKNIFNAPLLEKVNSYFAEDFKEFNYTTINNCNDIYFDKIDSHNNLYEKLLKDDSINIVDTINEIKLNNGLVLNHELNKNSMSSSNIRNRVKPEHIISLFKSLKGKKFELKKSNNKT